MINTAALLKAQIESQLAHRIPAALSPAIKPEVERRALADVQLNRLLNGGVPVGAITEVHGVTGSGRTSLAFSLTAAVTAAGSVAAWIDVSDALDPEAAALCGVDLDQFLWVRCTAGNGPAKEQNRSGSLSMVVPSAGTYSAKDPGSRDRGNTQHAAAASPDLVAQHHVPKPVGNGGCGSPHPRSEGRGMPEAIHALLQSQPRSAAGVARRNRRQIGTPGMPNREIAAVGLPAQENAHSNERSSGTFGNGLHEISNSPAGASNDSKSPAQSDIVPTAKSLYGRQVSRGPLPFPHASPYREEQVATDRQPSRRAVLPVARHGVSPRTTFRTAPTANKGKQAAEADPWAPLDQALRVVDLLLQAGGFSLLVLDLGNVPAKTAWRIPLATWFRFRAGCDRSRASLLVISQHPCARASADLTVAMESGALRTDGNAVVVGSEYRLRMEQQRRGTNHTDGKVVSFRKPVRADHNTHAEQVWTATGTWSVRA